MVAGAGEFGADQTSCFFFLPITWLLFFFKAGGGEFGADQPRCSGGFL
jgi:hypothetical protein